MASSKSFAYIFCVFVFFIIQAFVVNAQVASAPAPAPTSDGSSIDLGIAYGLMLVALLITYLTNPIDAFPFKLF